MKTLPRSLLAASAVAILGVASAVPLTTQAATRPLLQVAANTGTSTTSAGKEHVKAHTKAGAHHAANGQVKEAQVALNHMGYKLKVDGMMGKHTRAALRKFQKEHKLKVTGKPDHATLAALKKMS